MTLITLETDRNPEYGDVMNGYNELIGEFNKINDKIHNFPKYSIYTRGRMTRLRKLGGDAMRLTNKWLEHQGKARKFYREPRYEIRDDPQYLTFRHYQSILLDHIGHVRGLILVLHSNYDKNYTHLRAQLNFNIAIASFIISIVGLTLSLILI